MSVVRTLTSVPLYLFLLLLVAGFDEMRRSFSLIGGFFLSLVQASSIPKWRNESFGALKFAEDGTFQLSIFEDLHFGESKTAVNSRWFVR